MRYLDFSNWQTIITSLFGLALVALIGVGIRVVMMLTIQQRQQRMNRQINERLRTLIAAYKVLGGSFTGELHVDPAHLRDLMKRNENDENQAVALSSVAAERARRTRDAVEAALSDIILLGTDEQVRLAARIATDMVEGRLIQTGELVISLRDFIRKALDLTPIASHIAIPHQGPSRQASGGGKGKGDGEGGGRGGNAGGGGMGMGGGGMGGGMGMSLGMGLGHHAQDT